MPRFAHISDVHIGAFRQPELKELVTRAFEVAVDRCIAESVDFTVISGDIFDSNVPDLASVRRAARKIREATERGIRFYAVYGSHDFSPNYASIVDVLEGAGLFSMVERRTEQDGKVRLDLVRDPSGASLCGVSGRKLSLDIEDYKVLDRESLERTSGFKVFVFHGAVEELKPRNLSMIDAIPASLLPANFDYYAGGHVHDRSIRSLPGRKNIAFPGPLFATEYSELAPLAHGLNRGFYVVDFAEEVEHVEFVPIEVCRVHELHYTAGGKSSGRVSEDLLALAGEAEVKGEVVLLTVDGELGSGKTSDVDFSSVKKTLYSSGPLVVLTNYSHLASKELTVQDALPVQPRDTEKQVFEKEIPNVKAEDRRLRGERGVELSLELLRKMKEERSENEKKSEYDSRVEELGIHVLGLGEDQRC